MDEAMKPFSFESLFQRLSDTTAGEWICVVDVYRRLH
jgi:hypothetical protein